MRRVLIVLAGAAVVAIAGGSTLSAQQASSSLAVSATVSKNCTIATAPVNFGAYDPVTAHATAPLDAIGSVTVTCTKGAPAQVGLALGAHPQGSTRRMLQGSTDYLNYELYSDSGRTTVWGDTAGTWLDLLPAPDRSPRTFTVYGRVPSGQDAIVGAYADTVVATVNF